jgi:biopolymer transport protein TolR
MNAQRPNRRKPMSEINVVPYIDVMLVLLVIFMVTAPILTQGVQVDLPKAPSEPVSNIRKVRSSSRCRTARIREPRRSQIDRRHA